MKKTILFVALGFASVMIALAQDSPFSRMEIITSLQRPPSVVHRSEPAADIKGVQTLDGRWGIAYTADVIFRTDNGGATWRELLQAAPHETISAATFTDASNGYVIVSSSRDQRLDLLRTADGGLNWGHRPIVLAGLIDHEAELQSGELIAGARLQLSFPVTTSSNFTGIVRYVSDDDGRTWQFVEKRVELRTNDDAEEVRSGAWTIKTDGVCAGFKTGCVQETRLIAGGDDITPPQIAELTRIAKEKASSEAVPMFAAPPGGSTRISLNRGFDKCQAGSIAQMQLWWDNSPYHDSNIYMSGRARACPNQPFTNNPAWIDAVSAQGWGLIPTVVGYQAPCTVSSTPHRFSSDPAMAETQGRGEADIAVADANSIGLTTGSVIYYDMERYNDTGDGICRTATIAFLKGWTERIHELGYVSGVYGSPTNAVPDWWPMPAASRMDAIWMARWDLVMSVWVYNSPSPPFPAGAWENHQRIKQWKGPGFNETWGGVTFNIDGNIADGPVAGVAVAKNRTADFDGDRKTDISVFRPDTGVWYVQKSNGSGYIIIQFGINTDVVAPADFDGDGRTDHAVFRPSDGTWHILTKAGFYTARAFGTTGDIPAPADFNGDGKADLAVYRPSTGVWYIANSDSLGTFTIVQFGIDGDKPVVGDYDGDGKADIAVWRPSSGVWYVLRSSDGAATAVAFGIATDRPAQGDYDGDAKTDVAVLRDGVWYLLQSTAGFNQFQFGIAGDLPVTGDFDGDGRDDPAVFRPSTGVWYLLQSQNGVFAAQFGINGDRPLPNAYLPQ